MSPRSSRRRKKPSVWSLYRRGYTQPPGEEIPGSPSQSCPLEHRLACAVLCQACLELEGGRIDAAAFLLNTSIWHLFAGVRPADFRPVVEKVLRGTLKPSTLSIQTARVKEEDRHRWYEENKELKEPPARISTWISRLQAREV